MKICILGNSIGFRIRPPRKNYQELTYSEILESHGYNVRNVSKSAIMLNEAFTFLEEDVITFFPDIIIIHYGVVEVSSRRTFRWANNEAIINYYTNRFFSRSFNFTTPCSLIYLFLLRVFNSCIRHVAAVFNFQWQWLSTKRFLIVLQSVLEILIKETNASVIVIGVTPCSNRIENILRGSRKNIMEINSGMKAVCEQFLCRVKYLDPDSFVQENNIDNLVPDGIHFSAEGHRYLAEKLLYLIESIHISQPKK
jgi:hypothetical protein